MITYPLLQSQLGVFVECVKYPLSTQYNIPSITRLTGGVDLDRLENAIRMIYKNRKELRIRFMMNDEGEPLQYVSEDDSFTVARKKMSRKELERYAAEEFTRPYDLFGKEPLFRAEIVETEDGNYVLFDYHHILMDGVASMWLFTKKDMTAGYDGTLEESGYGMLEYAMEQSYEGEKFERDRKYFTEKFEGLTLSTLSKGSTDPAGRILRESAYIKAAGVDEWCSKNEMPVDSLFQAAFSHVLTSFSREDKVAYTITSNARYDRRLRDAYGMYVEMIPVLIEEKEDMSFLDLIRSCATEKMTGIRHHYYPFTIFCRDLKVDPGISFNFMSTEKEEEFLYLGGEKCPITQIDPNLGTSDITVSIYCSDNEYEIRVTSSEKLNDRALLAGMADAIKNVVAAGMAEPEKALPSLMLLSEEAEEKVISLSAGEPLKCESDRTFVDLVVEMAEKYPDQMAVKASNGELTYARLDKMSDVVADYLAGKGVRNGDFVAVMLNRVKEFPVAVLGIMKAGAAYVPIDPSYPEDRVNHILDDSGAFITLTRKLLSSILREEAEADPINLAKQDEPAYMIYTSGSTGRPKGVVQSHRSLNHFITWRLKALDITAGKNYGHFNSFAFDGSLDDLVCPLAAGACVHIFDEELRTNIPELCEYIKKNSLNGFTASTQLGMELIRYSNELPLDYLMMGGETLLPVGRTSFKVVNGYGPTEFTVCASYHILDGTEDIVPIGRPVPGTSAFICDHHGRLLPQGVTGELCLSGPQMADGYHNQPELTRKQFTRYYIGGDEVRVYRTGDLCLYDDEGRLVFGGRIDDQIKLRGFRVEFGEIEISALKLAGVEQAVVDIRRDQLVLYYISDREIPSDEFVSFLLGRLPDYMVPVHYVRLEAMPVNVSGKVDKKALPDPKSSGLLMAAPENETEQQLFDLVAKVLKTENFGVTDNLIGLGLTSITLMRLSVAIKNELGLQVNVSELMRSPRIRDMAELLKNSAASQNNITSSEARDYYPITENQRGVYLDWEMNRDTLQYNVPLLYMIRNADAGRLTEAVKTAINAHPYLKTKFEYVDGDLVQKSCEEEAVVKRSVLGSEPKTEYFQEQMRPFDILSDRLYRVEVASFKDTAWLFMDIHHIIFDGMSGSTLINEILNIYNGGSAVEESVTAYDYAVFEQNYIGSDKFEESGEYFEKLLSDSESASYPDSIEPDGGSYETVSVRIDGGLIDAFCHYNDVTAASFMQAALSITIQKITRLDRAVYAVLSNGRSADPSLLGSIGMFVRTLPAVAANSGDPEETAINYVRSVYEQMRQTTSREMYPFTKIVEDHGLNAGILYTFQGGLFETGEAEGTVQLQLSLSTVKFPITVTVYPDNKDYVLFMEYDGRRYAREDMVAFGKAICVAASSLVTEKLLRNVKLISKAEESRMIKIAAGEKIEYDRSRTWLDLFRKAVDECADNEAVRDEAGSITYSELDARSDMVAEWLHENGIRTGDFVAVRMDRVKEFIIAVVGIHKAGAAYVPVDRAYPADRIEYMLSDSEAKIELTEETVDNIIDVMGDDSAHPMMKAAPDTPAYMIYTSGTTGRPKGAVLHHAGLLNFVMATISQNELTKEDRISLHFSFSFDSHIEDVFPVLSVGATICMMPERIRREPDQIYDFLMENEITGGGYTTAIGKMLVTGYELNQRYITMIGEALTDVVSTSCRIFDKYGPTECTNVISMFELEKGKSYAKIPVGHAMPNGYIFIVDKNDHMMPSGVLGEICYAGPQVGYGYWKLEDKTKEVFEDCPFVEGIRMYHTGDLGRYNSEGLIECFGRIDNQVKLRGYRIELDEIESAAAREDGINVAAAAVKQNRIVLYYTPETGRNIDEKELESHMADILADYMVPDLFVRLEKMPYTPSGKIDRKALPEPVVKALEMEEPATEREKDLFSMASWILGNENFGVTDDLIGLGMTSIAMMRFVAMIRSKTDKKVTVARAMSTPTIRSIAALFDAEDKGGQSASDGIPVAERREYYPILENQRGVYLDWLKNKDSIQYNTPYLYEITGKDADKLTAAVKTVIEAHEYLSTRFEIRDGDLMQKRVTQEAVIKRTVCEKEPEMADFMALVRPFDLMNDRLYRIEVLSFEDRIWLFTDIHHIIYDGMSNKLLLDEIVRAYNGVTIEPETVTAYDLALFEQEYVNSDDFKEAGEYFAKLLTDAETAVFPNSLKPDGKAFSNLEVEIEGDSINAYCREHNVTAAGFMQTAVAETLKRLLWQDKCVFATISNGRSADFNLLTSMGMFVRTLPVAVESSGTRDKEQLTDRVIASMYEQMQQTMARELYPYTKIVEDFGIRAEIVYAYQGEMLESMEDEGIRLIPLSLDAVKFPVSITIYPKNTGYAVQIEYDGNRYNSTDMNMLASAIGNAALSLAKEKDIRNVRLINFEEESDVAKLSYTPGPEYDESRTYVDLFLDNVAKYPDHEAVVDHDSFLTYRELDEKSNALAHWLIEQGVGQRDFVAINTGRVKEFLIAIVGIHRAGAACFPIEEADYPEDRIRYMLEDSEAKLTITRQDIFDVCEKYSGRESINLARPDGYTYLFYTSGSTGMPKAVVLGHKGVYYFANLMRDSLGMKHEGRYGLASSLSFDGALLDYLAPITAGATSHIFDEHLKKEIIEIDRYITEHNITSMFMTTQFALEYMNYNPNTKLESLITGGEKLPALTLPHTKLYNFYGPTEFTVFVTYHVVDFGNDDNIPIGRPVAHQSGFVCDIYGNLVPRGALGELCFAGPQMAIGYWKRPKLTKEKFTDITVLGKPVKIYRTGDLVRYNEGGEIEFHGRIDNLVKMRGFRIEMGEIETCAAKYEGIRMAAAVVRKDRLVLYYQPEAGVTIDEKDLRAHLSKTLASYMVPVVYVAMEKIPLNSNNKINRRALPDPDIRGLLMVPPEGELEEELLKLAAPILKTDKFGVTDDMVALGMSSITMMRYMAAIQSKFGKSVTMAQILAAPTIRDIAAALNGSNDAAGSTTVIPAYERVELYPITENQRGLYLEWEMNKDTLQYNVPSLYQFTDIDPEKLADAVRKVIDAHEYLKNRLTNETGDLMQKRFFEPAYVTVTTADREPDVKYFRDKVLPFELIGERLYRAEVVNFGGKTWLFMDIHHIIYDGLSSGVLISDIMNVYNGGESSVEAVTAYEYALFEEEYKASDKFRQDKEYFDALVGGVESAAYPDSQKPEGSGCGSVSFTIDSDAIDEFCRENGVTAAAFMQAAVSETLCRITRQEDLVFATISNGRSVDPRLLGSIGMFVRTLPAVLKSSTDRDQTTVDYVKGIYEQMQNTISREMYPYTGIVEDHGLHADILYVFQGGVFESGDIDNAVRIPIQLDTVKFPIMITVYPDQGHYVILIEYSGTRFNRADMQIFATALGQAAISFTEKKYVREVCLVGREEADRIMAVSRGGDMEYDRSKTWIWLFREALKKYPDNVAVIDKVSSMTYSELELQSDRIAEYLIEQGVKPGEFVVTMTGRIKEFVAAAMGINKAGAAYVPIDQSYPEERIEYIMKDCAARVVLDDELVLSVCRDEKRVAPKKVDLSVPENLAYMIYTSGSTGNPKGVMIQHSAMVHFVRFIMKRLNMRPESRIGNHSSFSFDASIENIYPAICAGGSAIIVPEEARKDMEALYEFIKEFKVSGTNLTAQLGQLLGSQHELDMEYIRLSGEQMTTVPLCKGQVYNSYGPTETTVVVTDNPIPRDFAEDRIPIGKPMAGTNIYVVDKKEQLLPLGVAGELYIGGVQLAKGYYNRQDLTDEKFVYVDILGNKERLYKSGDLGKYVEDGKIDCLGRVDFQVKFRGFRVELEEIENRALAYPGIDQAAVQIRNDQLILYYTFNKTKDAKPDSKDIKAFLEQQMPEYMIPTVYMCVPEMPYTSNGKLNRKALPDPEYEGMQMAAPENDLERELYKIAIEELKNDQFGVTDNLVAVGLSSIAAMRYAVHIKKVMDKTITVAKIMKSPTIRSIAGELTEAEDSESTDAKGITVYDARQYYPITENQRGVYLDWELNRDTLQYNVPYLYVFENVDSFKLAEAVKAAVDKHGYLKTRLEMHDGDIMQRRAKEEAQISFTPLQAGTELEYFQKKVQPFDLNGGRLYRIEVASTAKETWLFMDIHHIIFDGLSAGVLMKDIQAAYDGQEMTDETVTAYDFSLFEQDYVKSDKFTEDREYFGELLKGAEAAQYRGAGKPDGCKSGRVTATIKMAPIEQFCAKNEVTAGNFMQAAFAETLKRLAKEDKVFYATISNGRSADTALMNAVGMFARTLPVVGDRKNDPQDASAYVKKMQEQIFATTARELYPYTKIVSDIRDHARIVFIFQGGLFENTEIEGIRQYSLDTDTPKFEIAVTVYPENDEEYTVLLEYDGNKYNAADMQLLATAIGRAADTLATAKTLDDVSLLGENEEIRISGISKGEPISYDQEETWVDMFLKSAAAYPDNRAVVDANGSLSYVELDRQSDAVAGYLMAQGVKTNDFVAVETGRSREFVIALLGVMKAGAAYVPVDPAYPEERRNYMLEDSGAKVILTAEKVSEAVKTYRDAKAVNLADTRNYAYMIYTSGSTGRPKGVIQSHRSLHHFAAWRTERLKIAAGGNYGHFNSFAFDGSLDDLICPLAVGATVHIFDEEKRTDIAFMADYIRKEKINGLTVSTLFGMELIKAAGDLPLNYLMMGGERLLPVGKTSFDIINGYGPTEFTVCSSYYVANGTEEDVPIGRPVPGTASYVCDMYGKLLPLGMPGELYLAGPQIAEGYLHQEELTAQCFTTVTINGEKIKAYKTGDIVRYDQDNQLMYIGRVDEQVKLRGFRIEFGEIERCAAAYPHISNAVADVRDDRLILYYTLDDAALKEKFDEDDLRAHLKKSLTDYMIPSRFVLMDEIPVTVNGKADKKALPTPDLATAEYEEPATEYEKTVAESMAETLGLTKKVGANDSFYDIGGDSIKALRFISVLYNHGLTLRLSEVPELMTVRRIAAKIEAEQLRITISSEPIEGEVEDSAIVRFFKDLNLPAESNFTQQVLLSMEKKPENAEMLQKALDAIAWQHDLTRAVYIDGRLVIRNAEEKISLEEYDITGSNDRDKKLKELTGSIRYGIEMDKALLRAALIHDDDRDLVFIAAHHLIIDGVSLRIILTDLDTALRQLSAGRKITLDAKTSTYRDYVNALKEYRVSDRLKDETAYWNKVQQKVDSLPGSNAKDYSRSFKAVNVSLDKDETSQLLMADRTKIRLDMNDLLVTAVARAYCRQAGTDEVSLQLEGHGREDISDILHTNRTVGWFTSIYPVVVSHILTGSGGKAPDAGSSLIGEDLVRVKETLHRVPEKGMGYNVLRFIEGNTDGSDAESGKIVYSSDKIAKIGFNYLGEVGAEGAGSVFNIEQDVSAADSDKNTFGADLNINCVIVNGSFEFTMTYNESEFTGDAALKMANGVLDELKAETAYLASLKENIVTATDYQENDWEESQFEAVYKSFADRNEPIGRIRVLTGTELSAIDEEAGKMAGIDHYGYAGAFLIGYHPGKDELDRAFDRLTRISEVFAASYVYENVNIPRLVLTDRVLAIDYEDASSAEDAAAKAVKERERLLEKTVDTSAEPLFKVTCFMNGGKCESLTVAIHPVVSSLTGIPAYLIMVKLFTAITFDTGVSFPITDLTDPYDPVANPVISRAGTRVVEFYKTRYDENKPTIVFIFGIILQMSIQHLIDDWSDRFNIVVIEDINYHYNQLYAKENFDYVIDFYSTLLELILPKKDGVFGYFGFSFGGEVGYALAVNMDKIRHSQPIVFLGDSDMIPSQGSDFAKEYTRDDLDGFLLQKFEENDIPVKDMLFAYSMLSYLNSGDKTFEPYYGRTVLLLAPIGCTKEQIDLRIMLARQHAKNFRVVEYSDRDHFNLHNNPDMLPAFKELFDGLLAEDEQAAKDKGEDQ